jgi:hypothetical protein
MRRLLLGCFLGAAVVCAGVAAWAQDAAKPKYCAEGRLASGACINPLLAAAMRAQSIIMAQPKFSYTAPARLPSRDYALSEPRHPAELRALFVTAPLNP